MASRFYSACNFPRPVRGAVRRGDGIAADLCGRHPTHGSAWAGLVARRTGAGRSLDGDPAFALEKDTSRGPCAVMGSCRIWRGNYHIRVIAFPVALICDASV